MLLMYDLDNAKVQFEGIQAKSPSPNLGDSLEW